MLAITSYYNPFRGSLRKANYKVFHRNVGIPLLTVEWSPNGEFDLKQSDADYLIQISGGDIVWQKERLLNIGLERAREMGFAKVAFLDCDIVFSDPEWFVSVEKALDAQFAAQCFHIVDYLPPITEALISRESLASLVPEHSLPSITFACRSGDPFSNGGTRETESVHLVGNPGMAIAVRIGDFPDFELYDKNLVGAGDLVFVAAALGRIDELFAIRPYSVPHQLHIKDWAKSNIPYFERMGWASNRIMHLWHGTFEGRKYLQRLKILIECEYNPGRDVELERMVPLKLVDGTSGLRERVFDYLVSRQDS